MNGLLERTADFFVANFPSGKALALGGPRDHRQGGPLGDGAGV